MIHSRKVACFAVLLCAMSVYGESLPRELVTDARVKLLVYSVNQVCLLYTSDAADE